MRLRPIAIIAASVLMVALASAIYSGGGVGRRLGRERPSSGEMPIAIGKAWDCPSGHAVKAYAAGGVYYPSNYPSPPAFEVQPASCFRTESEAAAQGYRLALPPAGAIVLEGVYLVPALPPIRSECAQTATAVGITFPCPTFVPSLEVDDICSGGRACRAGPHSIQYALEFTTPSDFPGAFVNPKGLGSNDGATGSVLLIVNAGDLTQPGGVDSRGCQASSAGPVVMDAASSWQACSANGPSTLSLTWHRGQTAYQVVPREQSGAARKLVELVASRLVPVEPISTAG